MTAIGRPSSRPIRWGAQLANWTELELERFLQQVCVAVRLEPGFETVTDANETMALAVNQLIRFVPMVTVVLPTLNSALHARVNEIVRDVAANSQVKIVTEGTAGWTDYDAVLNVGRSARTDVPWVTINSSGWIARVSILGGTPLPFEPATDNPIGALAAACLGVGAVAMRLMKVPISPTAIEVSIFDLQQGRLGSLQIGPELPRPKVMLKAILFGCGGVSNGWAYTVKRLPIKGEVLAIDKQTLRLENCGPYVCSTSYWLGRPKAEVLRSVLAPQIDVVAYNELVEHFKIRLDLNLVQLTPIVVCGLDAIPPRHVVQRMWPDCLIDMAAGGTTTQLITHQRADRTMCLLGALKYSGNGDYAEQLAVDTGITADRIRRNPTDLISQNDIDSAPQHQRDALESARNERRQICGYISTYNLSHEQDSDQYVAAAPFLSALSGVFGAAATMRALMGMASPIHHQFDLRTFSSRFLRMECSSDCACNIA